MSLTINSTSYAGEHALPFINAAVKSSRTIEAGGVKVMSNIKFRSTIQNVGVGNVIKDTNCSFADNVTVNTYERQITPKELMTTLSICKEKFHDDWLSKYQTMSANDNIPSNFETYLLSYIGSQIGSQLEDLIWTGDDGTDEFDGFLTRLSDSTGTDDEPDTLPAAQDNTWANGTDVASGEVDSTDADTVIAALKSVIADVPNSVYSKGPQNFMLYTGFDPVRALVSAYGEVGQSQGVNNQSAMWWNGGFTGLRVNGVDLFVAPGITGTTGAINRGTVIATYRDNLIFGTGLLNDKNEATVLDMAKLDGSRNVRIVYRYTAGTQIGDFRDVVMYSGAQKS